MRPVRRCIITGHYSVLGDRAPQGERPKMTSERHERGAPPRNGLKPSGWHDNATASPGPHRSRPLPVFGVVRRGGRFYVGPLAALGRRRAQRSSAPAGRARLRRIYRPPAIDFAAGAICRPRWPAGGGSARHRGAVSGACWRAHRRRSAGRKRYPGGARRPLLAAQRLTPRRRAAGRGNARCRRGCRPRRRSAR